MIAKSTSRALLLSMIAFSTLVAAGLALSAAESVSAPNPRFEQGQATPTGWQLVGGGQWVDKSVLEVVGGGDDSSYWRSDELSFVSGQLYHFQTLARRASGAGSAITGPSFANRDHPGLTGDWQWRGHVFRAPDNVRGGYLRLGQWHATGAIQFDEVRLLPVMPVHRQLGDLTLGAGELIGAGEYRFTGVFGHRGSNYHRTLHAATASFNSDRWVFGRDAYVTYRFALPSRKFLSGTVETDVCYHTRGACRIEVSGDGESWRLLAEQDGLGMATASLPAGLLPAATLYLRLRAADATSSFQINRVEFWGRVDGPPAEAVGSTLYANLERDSDKLAINSMILGRDSATGKDVLRVELHNKASNPREVTLTLHDPLAMSSPVEDRRASRSQIVPSQRTVSIDLLLPAGEAGSREIAVELATADGPAAVAKLTISVPDFYRTDYGQRIAGIEGENAVWWCDATHKVPRERALPRAATTAATLEAARNDREAVQIVVRPTKPLHGLTVAASSLVGPGGATITADNVQVLRVYYHFVQHPTDETGLRDWWPDALPPLQQPMDVAAGQNQPLWVLVYVPPDATAGDYRGQVSLAAEGFEAEVPLHLRVWDFALPKQNHLETAYGLSTRDIFQYHGLKTEADKRQVLDLYFRSFAEHRVSPYDPTPLDPIRVKFVTDEDPPRVEVDFSAFDRAMREAVERYGFTSFRLSIPGMGGGSFHRRYPPKIGPYAEQTPEYQALFSSCVQQLESHLREKGWLEGAYVYWFDEPAQGDYDFVAQGMRRLKQFAPGVRRMLTEEPGDNVLAGLVDIWCPVSYNYNHDRAEKRRAAGDRFWWYVCTGPKAPYCTLFIDHPASELRVWHWQTWQRNIVGTLVWRANYWTSTAAYPDSPQNPYADPMGYVSGYATPRGVRRYWGNGDGRFLYPPLAAAVPGASGNQPVIAAPVSSIRWEMIREGVEDYEYLYLLRELLQQRRDHLSAAQIRRFEALLRTPTEITADMTHFTTDSAPIYAHRRAIAEAIEALSR